jgi:hypothetical protein
VPLDAVRTALLTASERLAQVCLCVRHRRACVCVQPYTSLYSHFIHTQFASMLVTLSAGHNCLLYGVGEKTTILDAFTRQLDVQCCTYMRVDAYTNNVNMKVILQQLIARTANAPADCLVWNDRLSCENFVNVYMCRQANKSYKWHRRLWPMHRRRHNVMSYLLCVCVYRICKYYCRLTVLMRLVCEIHQRKRRWRWCAARRRMCNSWPLSTTTTHQCCGRRRGSRAMHSPILTPRRMRATRNICLPASLDYLVRLERVY